MRQSYYLEPRGKKGIFHAIFEDQETGRPFTRTTGTNNERDANTIAQQWLANGFPDNPRLSSGIDRKMTFCDFALKIWTFGESDYYKDRKTMGKEDHPEHYKEMQGTIKRYGRLFFKDLPLHKVTEDTVSNYLKYLKIDRELAIGTIKLAKNAVMIAVRQAKRKRLIRSFDFESVLTVGGTAKYRGILEREEVEALLKAHWPNRISRMAVIIANETGMRISEIRTLKVSDIREGYIKVEHSWGRISHLKSVKNQCAREVGILTELQDELTAYIENKNLSNESWLFPGKKADRPFGYDQIRRDFYKVLRQIGISDEIRKERNIVFHFWRHLTAKNLALVADRITAKSVLGIKTDSIFDHYSDHGDNETLNRQKNALRKIKALTERQNDPIPFHVVV
jgi:integrase